MKCKNCNEEFVQVRDTQDYCNKKECRIVRNREWRHRTKVPTIKNCVICGTEIVVKNSKITCSEECAKKRKQDLDKAFFSEYYKDNKELIVKKNAIWDAQNKDKRSQYRKQYNSSEHGKATNSTYVKYWYEANLSHVKEYSRKRYIEHQEEFVQKERDRRGGYQQKLFTRESEAATRPELLIDNLLHELEIEHTFQFRIDREPGSFYKADWLIIINDQKIIVEYLGLFDRADEIGDRYRDRLEKKLEFYSTLSDYRFLGLYPENLKDVRAILIDLKEKTNPKL